MMSSILLSYLGLAALTTSLVPVEHKSVSLEMANTLAAAALQSCRSMDKEAVVAVVDRSGHLIALQRGDHVGPHNTRAAERKAFTALSTKTSTSKLAERASSDPGSRYLATVPDLLLLGGGLPVVYNSEVIGGIGVAGSGGSVSDEQCALTALMLVVGK